MDKKKSAPLNAKVPVIKSPKGKLPAVKAKGEYFEFDVYAEAAQDLKTQIAKLEAFEPGQSSVFDLPHRGAFKQFYRDFAKGREAFEREDLYHKRKSMRKACETNTVCGPIWRSIGASWSRK
jgi:hypothetical protein